MRKRRLSRLLQPLNLDARHAPAVHFHHGEAISFEVKTFSTAGNESELRENESSRGGVGRIFRQQDVVLRFEIAEAERCVENHGRVRALPDDERLLHHIEFIVNFADQLFQDVLQRDQSQDGAEFVHDHRHPTVARAQLEQQFVRGFALRHDDDFVQHPPQVELGRRPAFLGAALPVEQYPHDILDVNVSEHVVARAFKHRQPRALRGDEHAHDIVERGVGRHRMHVGTRHHQLPHLQCGPAQSRRE